jgi:hypothetical protein
MPSTSRRIGLWSAAALVAIGVGYALALAWGIARHGTRQPIGDPVLAIMEALTLLAALAIVALMAAIHDRAATERKVHGLLALAFGTLCAGTTAVVHFVELTAARQLGEGGIVWPSRAYAAELLAWDLFLGLALLCAARVFDGAERAVRRALDASGVLCVAGTIGPLVGDLRLQRIGIAGYAVGLPIAAFLLARFFARPPDAAAGNGAA